MDHRVEPGGDDYLTSFCKIPAIIEISLRAYLGRPALIESPELNDDWPISTCAGTRLRTTGTFSYSRFLSSTPASMPIAMNAVTTVLPGSAGWLWNTAKNL